MIRYGPAGIPLSCKGRTLKDGIEDVHSLTLTALEVQMVRPQTEFAPPDEELEEVGKTIMDLGADSGFVIGLYRDDKGTIFDPHEEIQEDDYLLKMTSTAIARFADLPVLGQMAVRHDVQLSLHAPYYMDLGADPGNEDDPAAALTGQCLDTLFFAGEMTNAMGGYMVVTNAGPYDKERDREETDANIAENLKIVTKWWKANKLKPRIGIEVTGNQDVFGSVDQVLDLCDHNKALRPVLNFPHYQSRSKGALQNPEDFAELINRFAPYYKGESLYSAFASVDFDDDGNERWLMPIKKGDLKFEKLVDAIVDMNPEMTIISTSPLLEHDAVYMKTLTERALSKRASRFLKQKRKEEAAAEEAAAKKAEAEAAESQKEERSDGRGREAR